MTNLVLAFAILVSSLTFTIFTPPAHAYCSGTSQAQHQAYRSGKC